VGNMRSGGGVGGHPKNRQNANASRTGSVSVGGAQIKAQTLGRVCEVRLVL
jgi:hypothetical protein